MNLLRVVRTGLLIIVAGLAVWSPVASGISLTACGESGSCTRLRDDTNVAKATWDACNPSDPEPCIEVYGNPKDCTGVLSCNFAVNPHHRAEAEQAVQTIAQQSQGCYLCAVPNCATGTGTECDAVTHRCVLIPAGAAAPGELPLVNDSGSSQATVSPDM